MDSMAREMATLDDHRPLADSELDAVSGGWLPLSGLPGYSAPQPPKPTGHIKMGDIELKQP
jgi:hypothetical protein